MTQWTIEVDEETAQRWRAFWESHELGELEGLLYFLSLGAAYAEGQATLAGVAAGTHPAEEVERLIRRLVEIEGRYAVMKFRLFQAEQALRRWELSHGAIETMNAGLQEVVRRLQEENARLREALRHLQQNTPASRSPLDE
ncbi:hypothetical protein [Thermoflexus sp.]|uniref:hypothetical protein n=1 Tax=Thermoflexus sp. TaxID=1969742 RepID=UPI0025CE72F2|nr:hypothetical protein [Thermoflexus sp.]MDW8180352.1 hypothetical protein [Anaerolineae bacterium]MCS6962672.1 hypothetical protein [Thermoflexus sp.]MCS7350901.1 hypothetical protein [Thermoflexus sp.]MCX7690046.1 hypothetical protein [Thermoflexus sp.]MDW8185922.1 hypothetical protein [Anaerolineae bacterium]